MVHFSERIPVIKWCVAVIFSEPFEIKLEITVNLHPEGFRVVRPVDKGVLLHGRSMRIQVRKTRVGTVCTTLSIAILKFHQSSEGVLYLFLPGPRPSP